MRVAFITKPTYIGRKRMLKILRIEVYEHSHATEDEKKVMKALLEVFPPEIREYIVLVREELKGHYNNPIVRIRAETTNNESAIKTFSYILDRLNLTDLEYLFSTLDERVDRNGTLHLRISKQDAYLGRLIMFEGDDVVKVSIHLEGRRKKVLEDLTNYLNSIYEKKKTLSTTSR